MEVIGVAGQKQNGKDSLADYLVTALNNRRHQDVLNRLSLKEYWKRSAFAKAVKQIFMDTFGKDVDYVEKWKVESEIPPDLDMTVRKALQFIGDGFRQIKASIWIDLIFRDPSIPTIVSDARYVNELLAVKTHGGYNILVVHPERVNDDPNGSEAQMRPFAEYALEIYKATGLRQFKAICGPDLYLDRRPPDGWGYVDYVIINDETLEDFYERIEEHIVPEVEQFFKEAA